MEAEVYRPADRGVKRHQEPSQQITKQQQLIHIWGLLTPAMTKMFDHGEELTNEEYMKLYSAVYNFCTSGDSAPAKCGRYSGPHTYKQPTCELTLYKNIQSFLLAKVQTLEPLLTTLNIKDESEIIQFYVKHADSYFKATKQLNGICSQINNSWVKKTNSLSGYNEYHRIEHVAYMCWKKGVFAKLGKSVTKSILKLIQKERNGEYIPSENITAVIASLIKIGYDQDEVQKIWEHMKTPAVMLMTDARKEEIRNARVEEMELSFYRSLFEVEFFETTSQWIQHQVHDLFLSSLSSMDYIEKISQMMKDEMARVKKYFHKTTAPTVHNMLITKAVSNHRDKFLNAVPEAFNFYRIDTGYNTAVSKFLQSMHDLSSTDADDKSGFQNKVMLQVSIEVNERLLKEGKDIQKDPTFYVNVFKNTYESFKTIMKDALLYNDVVYQQTVKTGMTTAMNKNIIIDKVPNAQCVSETSFVRRIHSLLKNKRMEENLVEAECNSIMALFCLLPNQMGFERYYRNYFTLRVVEKSSISNDLELNLIDEMTRQRGGDFTADLVKLYREGLQVSPDLLRRFKESDFGQSLQYSFDITVFPFLNCPWTISQEAKDFIIPQELEQTREGFTNFFVGDGNKTRLLQWLHSRSKGELEISGSHLKTRKKYIVNCSLYQMTILLLFNTVDSLPFEEITSSSGLGEIEASKVVHQLVHAELLIVEKKGESSSPGIIAKEDLVKLNLDFHNKNMKISINTTVKVEQRKKDDHKVSEDTRRMVGFIFQATIVRIMKGKKSFTHNELIAAVIAESQKNGKITVDTPIPLIKKAIEELLTKEILKRDEDDFNKYVYCA